ncbi:uncharacterized protein LOC126594371 [Malus sylvestris]|uniref:uncharacterized protein LOC126594371 n=1 Tax=Malus sylvestris TaxID=3752 RepID=UPI0021AC5E7A|nr:uncharacterized protein LOC126594371 [Malus sylvestris]XP_050116629.1 uncharacterized protein LOC126594371 [Malus sylvestris]XP_050116630.1 uncharacterized protein LOC126594371 [Malus sylvestris]
MMSLLEWKEQLKRERLLLLLWKVLKNIGAHLVLVLETTSTEQETGEHVVYEIHTVAKPPQDSIDKETNEENSAEHQACTEAADLSTTAEETNLEEHAIQELSSPLVVEEATLFSFVFFFSFQCNFCYCFLCSFVHKNRLKPKPFETAPNRTKRFGFISVLASKPHRTAPQKVSISVVVSLETAPNRTAPTPN